MNNNNIINKIAEHYTTLDLYEKGKSKGKGKDKSKDYSMQHGEDAREFEIVGKKGDIEDKGKKGDIEDKGKDDPDDPDDHDDPDDPDDHDEEEEDEEEENDIHIIDMAYAAVRELVTFVSSSEHKKVALEVFTTAT